MSTVTVVGAGGIGTVLAAELAGAGHDVVVCARSAGRLVVERDDESHEVGATVLTDPAAVTVSDWVLLCVKAPDTPATGPWLRRACGPSTRVLVCQNGIDHVERVGGLIGPATAIPALVYIAAERTGAGRVRHRRGGHIVVPDDPEGRRATALGSATLEVRPERDFHSAAWRKLLTNVAANAITALTRRRMEVLADPAVRGLATALLAEAVQVGRSTGARLGADDVTATLDFYGRFGPSDGTSMLYDRLAGRRTEHASFNGAVCALGRRAGIPTPANDAVLALLRATEPTPDDPARTPS
ncbi:2-dehydropantoate 2-reductase [Pseudonocardia alni]|uniref:2-dehydropantoate 2-reductase n=1 Tax=Pseudonocardia alni TaxID=33907 RepID=UPI0033202E27